MPGLLHRAANFVEETRRECTPFTKSSKSFGALFVHQMMPRLRVHLEQSVTARTLDIERFRHTAISAPTPPPASLRGLLLRAEGAYGRPAGVPGSRSHLKLALVVSRLARRAEREES